MTPPLKTDKVISDLKTIKLKKDKAYTYCITELTLEQKDDIVQSKKEGTLDLASIRYAIPCENILLIGGTSKLNTSNVAKFMGIIYGPLQKDKQPGFKSHSNERPIHYRDYGFTEERQEESSAFINLCPDVRMSVNSLKRVINSDYCCIWRIEN